MINAVSSANAIKQIANQSVNGCPPSNVTEAIRCAAQKTGVDFAYLLQKAGQESGYDPSAKAATSSATGLYQFTSQTWLQMVRDHGADYGLEGYASHITTGADGRLHVDSKDMKQAILGLRKDPQISSYMAAEYDQDNLETLKSTVGGKIGSTELYLAHFLGAGGATNLIKAMRSNPAAAGDDILPQAASANRSVFYAEDGSARSVKEIYQRFASKFDNKSTIPTHTADAVQFAYNNTTGNPNTISTLAGTASRYSAVPDVSGLRPFAVSDSAQTSSLFATMVLAQMDMETFSHASSETGNNNDSSKSNNQISTYINGLVG